MSNNKRGNFFKFKNVQVVCRPNSGRQTRQNTQITSQGTTENQFADIAAAAYAEALRDINDILTDDESVHYSPPHQQLIELQIQVQIPHQQPSESDDTNIVTPENGTDSSLDTYRSYPATRGIGNTVTNKSTSMHTAKLSTKPKN